MTRKCESCNWTYDDEFRSTICPHDTFAANDGNNNFAHHPDSVLICPHEIRDGVDCTICDTDGRCS